MVIASPTNVSNKTKHDPFGMLLVGRNWEGGSEYRYGFNTQEQDDEVYGNGNLNTALFWEYDTRLGRRWNVDPVIKSFEAGYVSFNNSSINKIDIKGNNADWFKGKAADGTSVPLTEFSDHTEQTFTLDGVTYTNMGTTYSEAILNLANSQAINLNNMELQLAPCCEGYMDSEMYGVYLRGKEVVEKAEEITSSTVGLLDLSSTLLELTAEAIVAYRSGYGYSVATNGRTYLRPLLPNGEYRHIGNKYFTTRASFMPPDTKLTYMLKYGSKTLEVASYVGTATELGIIWYQYSQNNISAERATYNTTFSVGSIVTSAFIGAEIGFVPGFVAGMTLSTAGQVGEWSYDSYIYPEIVIPSIANFNSTNWSDWWKTLGSNF